MLSTRCVCGCVYLFLGAHTFMLLCLGVDAYVCVLHVSVCAHDAIISHVCVVCSSNICVHMTLHLFKGTL